MKKVIAIIAVKFAIILSLSSCEEVFEPSISSKKVILISPLDSVVSTDTIQRFYWQHDGQNLTYQLQIVSPSFDSIVKFMVDTVTPLNQIKINLTRGMQYQWRVKASNNWSSTPNSNIWTLWIK